MNKQHANKKALFIITALPLYEKNGASYNRIIEYAKALVLDRGIKVYLLSCDYPDDLNVIQIDIVPGVFICGRRNKTEANGSYLTKALKKQFDAKRKTHFLKNLGALIDQFNGKKAGFVYPSLMSYHFEKEIVRLFKTKNIPVFSERNELKRGIALNKAFPTNLVKKAIFFLNYPFLIWDFTRQDKLAKKYEGNIAISTTMESYLKKNNKNVIRVPILADVNKYYIRKIKEPNQGKTVSIGYTGSLTYKKDGVGELIKAIGILVYKYSTNNVHLNIYGSGYRDTIKKLKKQIVSLKLKKYITLYGSVHSDKIPDVLSKQDLLVLTRPVNLQTRYGFSTKLAEYMASSVPVLTTNVSDNALYIRDNYNGFIIESHRAKVVAHKLNQIIKEKLYLDVTIRKNAYQL